MQLHCSVWHPNSKFRCKAASMGLHKQQAAALQLSGSCSSRFGLHVQLEVLHDCTPCSTQCCQIAVQHVPEAMDASADPPCVHLLCHVGLTLHLDNLRIHNRAALASGPDYTGNVLVAPSATIGTGCLIGETAALQNARLPQCSIRGTACSCPGAFACSS
jgi:hypothetical protein